MIQSQLWTFPNRKSWWCHYCCINSDLYKEENVFLRAFCNAVFKLASRCNSINRKTVHQDHPPEKGTISISNPSHFHTNTEDRIGSCQSLAAPAPCVFPLSLHVNSHLSRWLMLIIKSLFLFTQHIYPSRLSVISWLTYSCLSLVVFTGLTLKSSNRSVKCRNFVFLFICKIGA